MFLFEQVNVLGRLFWGLFYYSVEFTSFHSFFTLSFHCIVYALTSLVNSIEDGHIYRLQNFLTHYFFIIIKFYFLILLLLLLFKNPPIPPLLIFLSTYLLWTYPTQLNPPSPLLELLPPPPPPPQVVYVVMTLLASKLFCPFVVCCLCFF